MIYLFLFFCVGCIIIDAVACWKIRQEPFNQLSDFPKVSILVAVRNEEKNMLDCLQSLNNLSYPNLEILIGDDNSTDKTYSIIQDFIQDKPKFSVFRITYQLGNAIAKANVLAHLSHNAQGEWFLITDADVKVPSKWVENMLSFANKASIITGFTWVKGRGIGAILQALDWTFALAVAKVFSYWRVPVTAMGNNMAVRKDAYLQTGGYENMPSTLVEDFILFKTLVIKQEQSFAQVFSPAIMAETQASNSFKGFLRQRKRWMQGIEQAHWLTKIYLLFRVGFYPILLLTLVFEWQIFYLQIFSFFLAKLLGQSIALYRFLYLIHKSKYIWAFVFYEFYALILSLILPIYYILPTKNVWKERKYD
jgi:cellulose synthase/poly-beta-1,6-N-acetylglucosamine synthase-like glycosyltransferase